MMTGIIQMCLLLLVLKLYIFWYVEYLWNRRNLYIYSWNVPGPLALPIIGASYLFIGSPRAIMNKIFKLHSKYSGLFKIWFGPRLIYSIQDPDHIEEILTKCLDKDYMYTFLTEGNGTSLATTPVSKWKKHRKMLDPLFNQRVIDSFVEIYAEQSVIFAEQLMKHVEERNFDLFLLASRCTLDIACETAVGFKFNNQSTDSVLHKHTDSGKDITTQRTSKFWLHLDFIWKLHPMRRESGKCVELSRNVTSKVIKKKIEELKRNRTGNCSLIAETKEGIKKRLAFLDLILETANFTEEKLREEVCVFLIAAADTTATTISNIFTILGLYQDVQQKVYEEVVELLGEERIADASVLPKLKYTERVIKETLRLFPAVPTFLRAIVEDVDIGETILPAGCTALFATILIHRNPKYWPDPLKFDPDRFLPEEIAKRHPATYIPFSFGPRSCIGARYGMTNLKTILSTVIRRFKITTEYKSIEEIQFNASAIIRLKDGPKISLELR